MCSKWIDLCKGYADDDRLQKKQVGGWIFDYVDPVKIRTHDVYLPKAYLFAKSMEQGTSFPPVKVGFDEAKNVWSAHDGAHRIWAARMLNKPILVRYKAAITAK